MAKRAAMALIVAAITATAASAGQSQIDRDDHEVWEMAKAYVNSGCPDNPKTDACGPKRRAVLGQLVMFWEVYVEQSPHQEKFKAYTSRQGWLNDLFSCEDYHADGDDKLFKAFCVNVPPLKNLKEVFK